LAGVLKKHEVTLLVMSVFSIVQMKQEVALGMCDHLQDLGSMRLSIDEDNKKAGHNARPFFVHL